MNNISIITPTGDRYESIKLLCQFLMRQVNLRGLLVEWVLVDDGQSNACARAISEVGESTMANFGISVFYLRRKFIKEDQGPRSLARNVLAGMEAISSQKLLIMEDDDCYREWYLSEMFGRLLDSDLVGTVWQKYYHLPSLSYRTFRNRGSAFCSTGMRSSMFPLLREACQQGILGHKGIDAKLWQLGQSSGGRLDIFEPERDSVIGMKGLPGRSGIGVGHRPKGFAHDRGGKILVEWCGEEYGAIYQEIRKGMVL